MADGRRFRSQLGRALFGIATSVGAAVVGGLAVAVAYVARCGVFFGEDWSVPDTLSADICGNDQVIAALFIPAVAAPLLGGLVATARGVQDEDLAGSLTWPLVVGGVGPAAVVLVYAASGFIPT